MICYVIKVFVCQIIRKIKEFISQSQPYIFQLYHSPTGKTPSRVSTEVVAQRCSLKQIFKKIRENHKKAPVSQSFFNSLQHY